MIKYRIVASRYDVDARIEYVEVEKETDASVWVDGRRNAKRSDWYNYFDTWSEAKAELIAYQTQRVESLRRQLEVDKSKLGNINGMKRVEKEDW